MYHLNKPVAAICLAVASAFVQAQQATYEFNIPGQPASQVLDALAKQTGLQPFFAEGAVKGVQSSGVKGKLSLREALDKALAGTGLSYQFTAERAVAIKAAPAERGPLSKEGALSEMVITATRTERRADEVPVSVSVITADDLRRQSSMKPQDALRNIEGVDFNTNTSIGAADVPQVRGIGGSFAGTTSSVLVDGVVTDSPISSVVGRGGFNFLSLQDIERIEVVRGPASALYGPNVVGGVVNVIAKRWTGEPGVEVNTALGSHNSRVFGVATGMANDRLDVRLSVYDFYTDGYRAKATDINNRNWQDRKWNLNGTLHPAYDQEISFGFQQFRNNQPNLGGLFEYSAKQEGEAYTVGYRKDFPNQGSFKVSYRHVNLLQSWIDPGGGMGVGNRKSVSDTVDAQVDLRPIENNVLSFGGSYQDADYKAVNLLAFTESKSTAKSAGLFIQDEHRFGSLALTAGARYDRIDLSPDTVNGVAKNGKSSVADVINPRLGARYHLTEETSLYASVGTAYLPALNSFKFVQPSAIRVDNPDLKPETSTSYEIGMNSRWSIGTLRTALFHTDYKDKVTLGTDTVSGKGQWQNVSIVKVDGFEFAYQGKLGGGWQPYANYSYTRARDYASPGASGTQSTRMSPHKFNAGLIYTPNDTWSTTLNARYVSGRYFNNLTQAQWADGYTQVDVKVSSKLPFQGQKWEAFVAANNLTNKKFEPFNKGEWSDGRTFMVGLNGRF